MNFHTVFCLILVTSTYFVSISARTSDELRITLPNGSKIVGTSLRSHSGRIIKAFIGIPYAKPPIGNLRFKAPEPIEPWNDTYFATHDRAICVQRNPFRRNMIVTGSEDCLFLNVYVPLLYTNTTDLSIMTYFHGGGFMAGSGNRKQYGPEHLLDHDVILVTANYRLGPLGFLSSGQQDCPGNFGLKDQVLVLKWIQQNIRVFGGNSESVTVFGESAGGASVTYLMMSPLTKGLISKAIAQSGTSLDPWAQPAHEGVAPKRAAELAEKFQCHTPNNWTETINCLLEVSAEDITAAFYDFFKWDFDPMVPFPPVVEQDSPGAFLTWHPRSKHDEKSLSIPLMTGLTFDEGVIKSAPLANLPGLFDDFSNNLTSVLPISLYYDHHNEATQEFITSRIIDFYFNNEMPSLENLNNVTNLFTDGWFLEGNDAYLRQRLSHSNVAPTYVYLFTHKGTVSFSEIFGGGEDSYYGVAHAEELQFLFPKKSGPFLSALPSETDLAVQKAMTELWVNFAKSGNPTQASTELPKWTPVNSFPLKFYRIGNSNFEDKPLFGMEYDGIFPERGEFWRKIGAHLPTTKAGSKATTLLSIQALICLFAVSVVNLF